MSADTLLYVPIDAQRTLKGLWLGSGMTLPRSPRDSYKVEIGVARRGAFDALGTFDGTKEKLDANEPSRLYTGAFALPADAALVARTSRRGSPVTRPGLTAQALVGFAGSPPGSARIEDRALRMAVEDMDANARASGQGDQVIVRPLEMDSDLPPLPLVLDASGDTNTIAGTASETTLYAVTVPASVLMLNRAVRLSILGDYKNSTGVNRDLTLRIKFGGTTLYDDALTLATNASRRPFTVRVTLACGATLSLQNLGGNVGVGEAGSATAGIGDLLVSNVLPIGGSSAEDATVARDLTVTVQHSAADANLDIRRMHALVEKV